MQLCAIECAYTLTLFPGRYNPLEAVVLPCGWGGWENPSGGWPYHIFRSNKQNSVEWKVKTKELSPRRLPQPAADTVPFPPDSTHLTPERQDKKAIW